ncbi:MULTISPECIES: dihydrodipicolinate reductase [unclassified Mycobacterium]|uniref:NAD(P)H-dependent amine dehydrogenase family protein n=1 Tax=unclassified Mycobacterium TaxID=2642494 RepID=UPI0008022C7F|nr:MULTISPECIES: dihydrodipicolinate reductase [unclassified Mycobacterium]OBG52640.1 dihydrodipicolinate reductase [Mycobacterium sp. E735]OBG85409.1 dihydrodipicolinate reductase [Mycobacterium sp. E3298]OBH19226.1 dihydrodipicolinate reductase [Mycobacterium sp. E1715]
MAEKVLRVAVISTGGVGSIALRAIHRRAHLDLVGVWVHSAEKTGRDAGDVVGLGPIGVTTTADLDDIIRLKPDCVVYAALGADMDAAAVPDYVRFLKAGINVVTTNTPGMMFPDRWIPDLADQVRAAALAGGVTIYTSGIEPGFAGDQFAVMLSTLSNTIRSVRAQEIFDYSAYPNEYSMFDAMGFGRPLDFTPLLELEGAQRFAWGPPIGLVARALGVELDEVTERYERVLTPRDLHVACGLIPAGTCGAVRAETTGIVNGHPVITIEHINRMAPDLAPEWASAPHGTYRVVIEGEPHIHCDLRFGTEPTAQSANDDAMQATAMRVVNAIPYVIDAAPGIATSLDLPITAPRNAVDVS